MQKISWGLIGCGDIARRRVAPALRDLDNCNLHAVTRKRTELVKDFAAEFDASTWTESWQELLKDDNIQAVYIATPVYLHAEQTIAAAKHGKHVLCEKPMAMSARECNEMINACSENNVSLGIAYYRHFYPVIHRLKELLSQGKIGDVVAVHINAFSAFDPEPSHSRYWLIEPSKSGGGPMMDIGCHRIEVMLNLFGSIDIVRSIINTVHLDRNVEDTATALFTFASGVHGVLSVSHAIHEKADTLRIYGTEGSFRVPNLNDGKLIIETKNERQTEEHPPHPNLHLPLVKSFTDSILHIRQFTVPGETGREVNAILDQIYKRY